MNNLILCGILQKAIKTVQPATRREGFSAIPNVKLEDVGGLDLIRKELDRFIIRHFKYHEKFKVILL